MGNDVTPIGITNYRNTNQKFGIKDKDRLQHIYCIGKSGTGKSTLLKSMAVSDIRRGNGICVIDPHGDVARELIAKIPEWRKKDLVYFNPKEADNTVTFNPLHGIPSNYQYLVASGLVSTFKKIWADSWGVRMEHILRFSLLALLYYPDATLLDIQPLLTNREFRGKVLQYVTDKHILSFWINEFDKYSPSFRSEAISPILNKTGIFLASVPLRNVVGQKTKGLKFQEIMDKKKLLICNLSKGEIGEDTSMILGSMIVTAIQLAALHRAKQNESIRVPFYLYIDECHTFITLSFADILAEARKYGLSIFLCHQYIEQLDERVMKAVFGNVGTLISFRVGAIDAKYLAKEFHTVFDEKDFVSLPRFSMYLKLMIDGTGSEPFSAVSICD